MGAHIRKHGGAWDAVIASPAERVKLHARSERAGYRRSVRRSAAYLADSANADAICYRVRCEAIPTAVLLVGPQSRPAGTDLDLVAPEDEDELFGEVMKKYPTAAFAVLELDIDNWADLASGCGKLVHFARPRDLDPELGPEHVG